MVAILVFFLNRIKDVRLPSLSSPALFRQKGVYKTVPVSFGQLQDAKQIEIPLTATAVETDNNVGMAITDDGYVRKHEVLRDG